MGVVWIFLFAVRCFAQPIVEVSEIAPVSLDRTFQVLEDPAGSWTIHDIIAKDEAGAFDAPPSPLRRPTYSRSSFWIKAKVHNGTQRREWYFDAQNRLWHEFDVYAVSGDRAPVRAERVPRSYPASRLDLEPHATSVLYARMRSPSNVLFEFTLKPTPYERDNTEDTFALLLTGAIISIFIYNAFFYWTLRERVQLYYLIFAAVNGYAAVATTVAPGIFFWPALAVYRPFCPLSTVLFTQSFFQTKTLYPKFDRIGRWINVVLLTMSVAALIVPSEIMLGVQDAFYVVIIAYLFTLAAHAWRGGYEPARLYMQGIGVFLLSILGSILMHVGILPLNAFTSTLVLQGQTYEVFLMSLALASRMRRLKEEKITADVIARHKGHLLRVMSHDMATPLSVITFLAKHIRDSEPELHRHTEKILRAADTIQNIRTFTMRFESVAQSPATPPLESVPLAKVFDDLQLLFEDQARSKGVKLDFELSRPDLCVKGDHVALTAAVFSNLVSNAIKFSHAGDSISIRARLDGDWVSVSVEDSGVGTSPEFLRSDHGSSTRGTAGERGTGFGLAIMEEYVQAFGGRVAVESRPQESHPEHHGTTFTVSLARAK